MMADTARTDDTATLVAPTAPHLRSCVVCRQRKVKCDRQQPCSNCTRSSCACVYPSGRGRAPKRARRAADSQLVDKLARLETIIQRLAAENGPALVKGSPRPQSTGLTPESFTHPETSGPATSNSGCSSPGPVSSIEASISRLVIDDKKSYYVSNPLWATMAQEIEELRDFLGKSEDEEEDERASPDVPSQQSNTNAALFGYRAIAHSLQPYHPTLPQAVDLFAAFNENVLPLLRIFHMPTLSTMYWDAAGSPNSLDKNVEALIFAIYYSATVSLQPEQCSSLFGLTHEAAIQRYRFAVEQAIARADLLTTQSMVLIQAVTLFINALRSHDGSRVSWSLTTLVFQISQTMGLHRDGTAFGLKPFETEMRRRLWWHICILDSRSSDYHGFGPMIYQSQYDTRIPLNVNDEDLSPEMTEPPPEREGVTDMCFCLVRCEAMHAATKIKLLSPDVPLSSNRGLGASSVSLRDRVKVIRELEIRLQDRYIRYCKPSSPIQLMTTLLSRLIVVHFWLMTYYPLMRQDGTRSHTPSEPTLAQRTQPPSTATNNPPPPPIDHPEGLSGSPSSNTPSLMTRDQLFQSSIEVLQLSSQILNIDTSHKWSWYSKIHIQWHIVAFVLSEICRRPPSPDCDRAWAAVTTMYTVWNVQSGATPGLMWKSVRRLMAKTKYMREMQALRSGRSQGALAETVNVMGPAAPVIQGSFMNVGFNPPVPPWDSTSMTVAAQEVDPAAQLGFHQGVFGMADDTFMDILDLPDDLPMDVIFNSLGPSGAGFSGGLGDGQAGLDGQDWKTW